MPLPHPSKDRETLSVARPLCLPGGKKSTEARVFFVFPLS